MTLVEAQKVAAIVATADGGCSVCVRDLVEQLNETFKDFTWLYDEDQEGVSVYLI